MYLCYIIGIRTFKEEIVPIPVYKIGGSENVIVLSNETIEEVVRRLHNLLNFKTWNLSLEVEGEATDTHRACLNPYNLPTRAIDFNQMLLVIRTSHTDIIVRNGDTFTFDVNRLVINCQVGSVTAKWTFENFV